MKRYFLALVLFISGIAVVSAFSDPFVSEYFSEQEINVNIYNDTFQSRTIRYIETYKYDDVDQVIFLLHGALSMAMKYKKIMADTALLNHARIIALDRPGYGESSPGIPMVSIEEQTQLVDYVLSQFDYESAILVGHSYGAAIVANHAFRYPEKDYKLLMLSAAIDPELEVVFPTSNMVKYKFANKFLNQKSRVAAYENLSHEDELEKLTPIWSKLNIPVYHIHGVIDPVISYRNTEFSQKHIKAENLTVELLGDVGHSMIRYKRKKIVETISEMMGITENVNIEYSLN